VLTIRLRHTRRTPSGLSGSEPFGERLAVTVSRAGGMLVGAYLAGVLTIGAGGRLMMRVNFTLVAPVASSSRRGSAFSQARSPRGCDRGPGKVTPSGPMSKAHALGQGASW
jgi:hypothetical protein